MKIVSVRPFFDKEDGGAKRGLGRTDVAFVEEVLKLFLEFVELLR